MNLVFLNLLLSLSFANVDVTKYSEVYKNLNSLEQIEIADPFTDKALNKVILIAKDKNSRTLGFIREVNTTTGCDSACLPVIFTLFYDENLTLLKLKSIPGLTKKFHAPFSKKDYEKLDIILMINPKSFQKITHPTQMVDAISGATLKEFKPDVVSNAAYTSLRVNSYHQQTILELKKIKAQKIRP